MNVAVVDFGKPGVNFGWAIVGDVATEGTDIDACVETLAAALRIGLLALGFEAPMFIPIRTDSEGLTAARSERTCLHIVGSRVAFNFKNG